MAFKDASGIGIHHNLRLQPACEFCQLRFRVIGFDIHAFQRHQGHQTTAGLDILSGLGGAIADHAGKGRADGGKVQIALGLAHRAFTVTQTRFGFRALRFEHLQGKLSTM